MVKRLPPKPPEGEPEWIEKGFPAYENPNWWQKKINWLFAAPA